MGTETPVVAICYDFDKTLSPDDMQAQGFIQQVGYDVKSFWAESNTLAKEKEMDQNLAWMFEMKQQAEGKTLFTKDALMEYGSKVKLFPGVKEWFDRIRAYGDQNGVKVEHYIISSGLKEMIEGSVVGGKFEKIFASSFLYNDKGVAVWPAQVINYTNKTQFLFRIEKGLDINDQRINDHFAPDEIRIPFRNIIYIGDSDTDIPCMKLVNSFGGYSIGVYNDDTKDKEKVYKMIREDRIKYFVPADYREGKDLDVLVKQIIEKTAKNEWLERKYYSCLNEVKQNDDGKEQDEKRKMDLILALEDSYSFAQTHRIIDKMKTITTWTDKEADTIARITVNNSQVRYVAKDGNIQDFLEAIMDGRNSENIMNLQDILAS